MQLTFQKIIYIFAVGTNMQAIHKERMTFDGAYSAELVKRNEEE